ncbi:MAG: NUDIX hydrolase [bacterium]|nr:NUDIX hydrolase [Planctomycetota bacterium]HIL53095.1 NUDIX hydrolase [Planctomycetota bacterium]
MPPPPPLSPWRKSSSRKLPSLMIFRPRMDTLQHPKSGESFERLVLEAPEWVNVVAREAGGRFIFVRQYRFGIEDFTSELPGGLVERGEEPALAARRELREETGYTSEQWIDLGCVQPNPAVQNNRCHHFLALDVEQTHGQDLDSGEDIEVLTLSEAEVLTQIASGELQHALVITALSRVLDLRQALDQKKP